MRGNLDGAAKFKNGKQIDGRAQLPVFAMLRERDDDDAKAKRPQTPYVPTMKELVAQYERDTAAVQSLVSADYEKWMTQNQFAPSRDEYVITRQVDRDPGNPKSGKLTIIERNPDGSPKIHEAKYQAAMAAFKAMPQREEDLREIRAQYRQGSKATDDNKRIQFRTLQANEETYKDSRAPVVTGANNAIKGAGLQSRSAVEFRGRSIAGSQGSIDRNTKPLDGREAPVNEVLPRKNQTDFVTVILPPDKLREEVEALEKVYLK
jgi:hypothetical protein